MRSPELAQALENFRIDAGDPQLTFPRRLANENSWTPDYAERVVREYFRFVYLACIADQPVTPSIQVDQAWHLHLCYTRSYWEQMCGEVLHRPLHHGPTRGGVAEAGKFRDWYQRTLALYQAEFGQPPPNEIWPEANERFDPAHAPLSVSRKRFILIEKRRAQTFGRTTALSVAVLLGCGALAVTQPSGVVVGLILLGLIGAGLFWLIGKSGKGGGGSSGSSCGSSGCGGNDGGSAGHSGCGGDSGCGGSGCGGGGGCGGGD